MFDPGAVPVFESVFDSAAEQPERPALRPVALTASVPEDGQAAARRGLVPVVPALREVLPDGGLRRGTAVSVAGGDAGLLLALAAGVREAAGRGADFL